MEAIQRLRISESLPSSSLRSSATATVALNADAAASATTDELINDASTGGDVSAVVLIVRACDST